MGHNGMAFDGSDIAQEGLTLRPRGSSAKCTAGRARTISSSAPKPLDLVHLGRYTMGDRALEAEILALFIGEVPRTLASMYNADDLQSWKSAAHTLKGSGRAVGAWRIAQLAEDAERLGRDQSLTDRSRADVLARLDAAADEAADFIAELARS